MPDYTRPTDLIKQLIELHYDERNYWEDVNTVGVLPDDVDYVEYDLSNKQPIFQTLTRNRRRSKMVRTDYYAYEDNPGVCADVVSIDVRDEVPDEEANNFDWEHKASISRSLILRNRYANASKSQKGIIPSIQLWRYDCIGSPHTANRSLSDDETVNAIFDKYFTKNEPCPHFHFCSRSQAERFGNTAKANAISLDHLIKYITDLNADDDETSVLNTESFSMPFLTIKQKELDYYSIFNSFVANKIKDESMHGSAKTKSDMNKLDYVCHYYTKSMLRDKKINFMQGLDGVLYDLLNLKAMQITCVEFAEEYTPSAKSKWISIMLDFAKSICTACGDFNIFEKNDLTFD